MTEFTVAISLRDVVVSANTPAEALATAADKVAADMQGHIAQAIATKLDRITVTGLNGSPR